MVALAGGTVCRPAFGVDEDAGHAVLVKPVAAARRPFKGVGRERVVTDGASGAGVDGRGRSWTIRDPADDRGLEDLVCPAIPEQLLLFGGVEIFAFPRCGIPLAEPSGKQGNGVESQTPEAGGDGLQGLKREAEAGPGLGKELPVRLDREPNHWHDYAAPLVVDWEAPGP